MGEIKEDCDEILTDSNQSSLRTVLVTFRIEKPSAKLIKRVRFNSLVEVKFIPRRRKREKKKYEIDLKEDKGEKTSNEEIIIKGTNTSEKSEHEESDAGVKDTVSVSGHNVTMTADEAASFNSQKAADQGIDEKCRENRDNIDDTPNKSSESFLESGSITTRNNQKEGVDECSSTETTALPGELTKSKVAARKSYTASTIMLGADYVGNALRLNPTTFPVSPAIQLSEFPVRNSKNQNFHELAPKAVWRLEKQAAKFCKEAEALITKVTEKSARIQSKLKEQPDTVVFGRDYKPTFLNEFTRKSNATSHGKTLAQNAFYSGKHTKGSDPSCKKVTRFPYIKNKKQPNVANLPRASSELSLPQLLMHDGNGAHHPETLAKPDGKSRMHNHFDRIKKEKSQNENYYYNISYTYGRTRLGVKPKSTAD